MLKNRIEQYYLRPPRIKRLSLTSLIDVIFLLLLFFMLSSTFTKLSEVDIIEQGKGQQINSERPDVVLQLGENGWRINGQRMNISQGIDHLHDLADGGARNILILSNQKATTQDLVSAIEKIRAHTPFSVTVSQ